MSFVDHLIAQKRRGPVTSRIYDVTIANVEKRRLGLSQFHRYHEVVLICFEHCGTERIIFMFTEREISTFVTPQCTSIGHKGSKILRNKYQFYRICKGIKIKMTMKMKRNASD